MDKKALYPRPLYLEQMKAFQDTEMIKVITGIRRCGKSSIMKLMVEHLLNTGVERNQILEMNFESLSLPEMDVRGFYEYVKERIGKGKKTYLFFDEIQRLPSWEEAVNSFRVDFDCDIYITGSNAYLLSSELSTYLSGRYVEIKVYPLSFVEFIEFQGYQLVERKSPLGDIKKYAMDGGGFTFELRELLDAYLRFGGMPVLKNLELEEYTVNAALDGVYSAAVINDILAREERKGRRSVTDAVLLRRIILFLADNIGNNTSANSISNTLLNESLLTEKKKVEKPAVQTVQTYIQALTEAYIFYEINRFDIKGKDYLRTLGKYYIVDIGLRNYLLGYREGDRGHILENIVYFELLRRGYQVAIGKIEQMEIDFIAIKGEKKLYIQVSESILAPETRERELRSLRKVRDNHEKIVLSLDANMPPTEDGIKLVELTSFLSAEF